VKVGKTCENGDERISGGHMAFWGKWKGSINFSTTEVVAHKILKVMIDMTSCFEIVKSFSKMPILSIEYIQLKMAFLGGNLLACIFKMLI
jgi:hypothetical protein